MLRVGKQHQVGMRVHVDEAGTDDAAVDVDNPASLHFALAGTHDGHGIARNANPTAKPGLARAVYDAPIAEKQVKHIAVSKRLIGSTAIDYHSDE